MSLMAGIFWTGVGCVIGFLISVYLAVEMLKRRNLYAEDGSGLLDLSKDGAGVEMPGDQDETIARLRVFKDGSEYCVVLDNFIDLQRSPAVFYHGGSCLVGELYNAAHLLTRDVRMKSQ